MDCKKRRVVITGMGVIQSLGNNIDAFWKAVKKGECGISKIESFDTTDLATTVGAEIKDYDPTIHIDRKEARRMDRFTQFAISAACEAFKNSGINKENIDGSRMGVIIGSGFGGLQTLEKQIEILKTKGPSRISPFFATMLINNIAAAQVAIRFGARGFSECVSSGCSTSNNAVGDAFKIIQSKRADIMITGGTEASMTRLSYAGFCAANRSMSQNSNPKKACRPFDIKRDGFVMGEGAGILILEEIEHAKKRGAKIIAEIIGYGCTNDAYHVVAPAPEGKGSVESMKEALLDAGLKYNEVDYINAHGTSTVLNDKNESKAIKTVFKEQTNKIPVSSTKSITGHLMGAAGAVEAIITSMALKEGYLPPTINYENPDPECNLKDYVANKGRKKEIKYALSNGFGFGGHNVTLAFAKYINE